MEDIKKKRKRRSKCEERKVYTRENILKNKKKEKSGKERADRRGVFHAGE